ncbi:MAG: TetR/AcrR family transcriptional regulator [Phycisphaerales bacterium]|nr:TetR/AcrR family transcriptional regulator [Phycisphaerales bacterium]
MNTVSTRNPARPARPTGADAAATPAARRAREQAALREKILAAARDLFVRQGYEAVSMRRIAEAIEYTPPAIYTHFRDKSELMRELCRRDFETLAARFLRLRRVHDPVERILRAGLAYIAFAVEHPNHYRLMFMSPPPCEAEPDSECLRGIGDPEQDGYAFLNFSVADAITQGRFRPEFRDAEFVSQVLWAGVHGLASLLITHRDDPLINWHGVEKLSRGMCESLLRGMLTDPRSLDPRTRKAPKPKGAAS